MNLTTRLEELFPAGKVIDKSSGEENETASLVLRHFIETRISNTLTAIEQDILELIGEDSPKPPLGDFWDVGRNQLRQELRTKLHKYIRGSDG